MATISFIGAGNLAGSLVRGLLKSGFDAAELAVADRFSEKTGSLAKACPGIEIRASSRQAATDCKVLIVCVKPEDVRGVCDEIKAGLLSSPSIVLVSVAAGVTLASLSVWTREALPIVRCMPNTPVSVGCGMSVLCSGGAISAAQHRLVDRIFSSVGRTAWIEDETLMDVVTAVSGSGPAYFFRVMESLERAAMKLGLDAVISKKLVTQTALGAVQLVHQSNSDVKTLREMVTSKGGTTECAIDSLEQRDIDAVFERAILAAARRSREISRDIDKSER